MTLNIWSEMLISVVRVRPFQFNFSILIINFVMTESALSAPHVYYSVPELSAVKDVRVMRNTKIKTVGYICRKKGTILKEFPDSSTNIALDLSYIQNDILEIYPYIIFGVLCTVNEAPLVAVKFLKRFNSCEADLDKYKEQCLLLRNRLSKYDNISNLAKIHNWTLNIDGK